MVRLREESEGIGDELFIVDLADGGRWEYTYDNAGQLTGGTRFGPKLDNTEGTLVQYAYQYDSMGNPTQRTEDSGVSTYTYNNLNQLVTGDWSGTLSVFGWTAVENLDHVQVETGTQSKTADVFQQGEWTAKGFDVPAGDNVFTVTRVANDQTSTQQQTTVTRPADQTQYQHDANGNLLGDGKWTYTWNNENRLVAAEIPQQERLEFVYDHHGRRRVKKVYSWDAQAQAWTLDSETHFIWLDWLLLETRDVTHNRRTDYILGTDLSGSFQGAGLPAHSSPGATAGGIGGILCSVTTDSDGNTAHQCFFYDFNGNVVNLADPVTGTTTATYEYSPFGKLLISTGPSSDSNAIRFSTKWQDETGLYYYGYRYYDANVGRWISRDPKAESVTWNVSLYTLLNNSAITMIDYLGLEGYPECDSDGNCYVDDLEWNQCGFKGTTGLVPNCQPPSPQPSPPPHPGGLTVSDCGACGAMTGAINRVNTALGRGDCRKWFEDHGHDYSSGLPTRTVKCHGNLKLVCCSKVAPAWTFPGIGIGVCKNQCNDYDEVGLASLLIHELAHHYCTWGPGREECAESAQVACQDALLE